MIHGVGTQQMIGIGHTDEFALVMCEIEIILPEWIVDPVGYADERGAVDVAANAVVHFRGYDGVVFAANGANGTVYGHRRARARGVDDLTRTV